MRESRLSKKADTTQQSPKVETQNRAWGESTDRRLTDRAIKSNLPLERGRQIFAKGTSHIFDENAVKYQLRLLETDFRLFSLSRSREGRGLFAEGKTYLFLIDVA